MTTRRTTAAAVALLAVLTFVVGCSSSDGGSEGAEADVTTTAPDADGSTTTAADGGDDDDAASTTTAGSGDDEGSGGSDDIELSGDFCEKARQLEGVGNDLFGDATSDTSPDALLAGLQDLFRTIDTIYGQLNEDPPAAIADEIALLAEFASTNYEKVKDMTSYEEAAAVAQSAFGDEAGSDEFDAASDKIGEYVEEECGLTSE
jgi:hypothetical protein